MDCWSFTHEKEDKYRAVSTKETENIRDVLRRARLRRHEHVERMTDSDWVKRVKGALS